MHTVCYVFQKLRHFQQCSYIFTAPGDKGSKTKGTKSIQTTPRPQNNPVPPLKTATCKKYVFVTKAGYFLVLTCFKNYFYDVTNNNRQLSDEDSGTLKASLSDEELGLCVCSQKCPVFLCKKEILYSHWKCLLGKERKQKKSITKEEKNSEVQEAQTRWCTPFSQSFLLPEIYLHKNRIAEAGEKTWQERIHVPAFFLVL